MSLWTSSACTKEYVFSFFCFSTCLCPSSCQFISHNSRYCANSSSYRNVNASTSFSLATRPYPHLKMPDLHSHCLSEGFICRAPPALPSSWSDGSSLIRILTHQPRQIPKLDLYQMDLRPQNRKKDPAVQQDFLLPPLQSPQFRPHQPKKSACHPVF